MQTSDSSLESGRIELPNGDFRVSLEEEEPLAAAM